MIMLHKLVLIAALNAAAVALVLAPSLAQARGGHGGHSGHGGAHSAHGHHGGGHFHGGGGRFYGSTYYCWNQKRYQRSC
jgi:uncharacterized membrane protein YgcG